MAKISYIDDEFKYIRAFIIRDYAKIADEVRDNLHLLTYSFVNGDRIYGYYISENSLLSAVYHMNFFVIHFCFVDVDTLHNEEQEKCMFRLMEHLVKEMQQRRGYYNIKLPANIVDLVRAYNRVHQPFLFCGGSVLQYVYGRKVSDCNENRLQVYTADKAYILQHKDELLEMTYRSFETYQGQYHCSSVTGEQAGNIYEQWIKGSLEPQSSDQVVISEYKGVPIGFVTIKEDDFAVEGMLAAVRDDYRKYGAYKSMIAFIINYANANNKCFITGTQFDNFIVQGVWNSLGMKPFYSFYNIHADRR